MSKAKKIAIIFAWWYWSRMWSSIPKQFMTVYGKEIIMHTLERFQCSDNIDSIYVWCIEKYIPHLESLVEKYHITKIPQGGIISWGDSWQDTIYKVLKRARQDNAWDSICLIHDWVRPIINDDVINANIKSVEKYGSAITATKAFETPILSLNGNEVSEVLERNLVYTAQAPQSFRLDEILSAHEKVRASELGYNNPKIVDSCSLMKECGNTVHLIEGNRWNIKVTTQEDYIALLGNLEINDYLQIFNLWKNR